MAQSQQRPGLNDWSARPTSACLHTSYHLLPAVYCLLPLLLQQPTTAATHPLIPLLRPLVAGPAPRRGRRAAGCPAAGIRALEDMDRGRPERRHAVQRAARGQGGSLADSSHAVSTQRMPSPRLRQGLAATGPQRQGRGWSADELAVGTGRRPRTVGCERSRSGARRPFSAASSSWRASSAPSGTRTRAS